jgi:hypothetical protein
MALAPSFGGRTGRLTLLVSMSTAPNDLSRLALALCPRRVLVGAGCQDHGCERPARNFRFRRPGTWDNMTRVDLRYTYFRRGCRTLSKLFLLPFRTPILFAPSHRTFYGSNSIQTRLNFNINRPLSFGLFHISIRSFDGVRQPLLK